MVSKCEAGNDTYIFQLIEMLFSRYTPLQFRIVAPFTNTHKHTYVLHRKSHCVQLDSSAITILCRKHANHT